MTAERPVPEDQLIEAEEMAGMWMHRANLAAEAGDHARAERHYGTAQKWQDKMNRLLGNGDGT